MFHTESEYKTYMFITKAKTMYAPHLTIVSENFETCLISYRGKNPLGSSYDSVKEATNNMLGNSAGTVIISCLYCHFSYQ